ncbi:MAG: hypothetical protein KA275_03030 [Chitinophagaceae bacterium]|nr:hypothetical protein [Chitinophagaceae bacterium]
MFKIIIKIFGLFYIQEIINFIPQLISTLLYYSKTESKEEGIWSIIFTFVVLAFYILISFILLFKTNFILDILKLDQEFNQEEFSFNISISKALIIAIFIIAGLILINEIPNLFKQLFLYYQKKQMTHATTKGDFSYIILSAVKVIIALLLIGERKKIVDFIDK